MEEEDECKMNMELDNRICRCCLVNNRAMVYAAPFNEYFVELAGINVKSSDGLPQWICIECLTLLRKAVRFKTKMLRAETVLKDYLSRCAPFPIDGQDQELLKYAQPHLSSTEMLSFSTEKSKNGFHKVLQHKNQIEEKVNCLYSLKMEFDEPELKVENDFSDFDDNMPLLELRINKDSASVEGDNDSQTTTKKKKDVKSKRKKKKQQESLSEQIKKARVAKVADKKNLNRLTVEQKTLAAMREKKQVARYLLPDAPPPKKNKREENENLEEKKPKRSSIRKTLELDPEKIRVITLNPEEQIKQREEESKNNINFMYQCKLCFKGFNFESKLENHMTKHSPSRGKYLCTVCHMYLPTVYSFQVHNLIHTRRYECVKCGRRMIDRQSIYNHYRTQHEGITTIITCDICGKESSNDKTHRSHMRNHHSGERPKCDQCGKTFINKDSLTEHILIHTDEKKYACPLCNKRCRSRAHVKNHMKMHSDVKEFYCVECDVRFKTAHNLRVHLTKSLKHKDEMSFKYVCTTCSRRFESASRLSAHTRVQHLGLRPHACTSCGARLASRASLLTHTRTVHGGRRPPPQHVCHTCGRAFRGKSVLINHMRTHTGEKPYSCVVCGRAFSQRTALATHHKLVHLKIKNDKNTQKQTQTPIIEKVESLFPKSEPQPVFDTWSRPCEVYYTPT